MSGRGQGQMRADNSVIGSLGSGKGGGGAALLLLPHLGMRRPGCGDRVPSSWLRLQATGGSAWSAWLRKDSKGTADGSFAGCCWKAAPAGEEEEATGASTHQASLLP